MQTDTPKPKVIEYVRVLHSEVDDGTYFFHKMELAHTSMFNTVATSVVLESWAVTQIWLGSDSNESMQSWVGHEKQGFESSQSWITPIVSLSHSFFSHSLVNWYCLS